jgi:hypothetical protein
MATKPSKNNTIVPIVVLVILGIGLLLAGANYVAQNNTSSNQATPTPSAYSGFTSGQPTPTPANLNVFMDIRDEVIALQQSMDVSVTQEDFVAEVQGLRRRIAAAYQTTDAQTQVRLQSLDQQLQEIEAQSRENLAGALVSFEQLVDQLEGDIADDQPNQPLN